MIETTICLNCQEEFEYRPNQNTIEDFDNWELTPPKPKGLGFL